MLSVLIVQIFVVVACVAGIVLLIVYLRNEQRKLSLHRAQMAAWAAANGWSYQPWSVPLAYAWPGEPFISEAGAQAIDVVSGAMPSGQPFWSFMYQYQVQEGRYQETVRIWILALGLPEMLPWLNVTPKGKGKDSKHDILLESDEFNRAFHVAAASQAFAYAVLNPPVMAWLMEQGRSVVPFRFVGGNLVCWRYEEANYAIMVPVLELMSELFGHIPSFVWHDYGAVMPPVAY